MSTVSGDAPEKLWSDVTGMVRLRMAAAVVAGPALRRSVQEEGRPWLWMVDKIGRIPCIE